MSIYSMSPNLGLEQAILDILHSLPYERVVQVFDFARFLQNQPVLQKLPYEDITEAELLLEELAWEQTLVTNQDMFRALAEQAQAEFVAGETKEMVIENGKIAFR